MLISLNELKKLVKISLKDEELFRLIGSRLVEIEGVEDLSKKYRNIFCVKVVSCEKIEGTHLSLCQIDAGRKDLVQVVCGAPNVKKDMFAVWIAPGAIVPATFETSEPFEISSRKLRGFDSNGMLAGLDELALGDDHSGIVELDPSFVKPGDSFAEKFGLNDKIIEVENKSLTHRPDCFGLIGFAREIAGILGEDFKEPELQFGDLKITTTLPASALSEVIKNTEKLLINADSSLCPRYSAAIFELSETNLNSALETPNYLTSEAIFLAKAGMHSISKIVDATNLTMLLTGQPLHAFDYDKFLSVGNSKTPEIGVRLAKPGETLVLLDDSEVSLTSSDIIITSSDVPIALAGAMGGKATEIDENTKKVLLESATFSLYNLRKTQMVHGIFSEAITRFTKGQPASGTVPALARCAALLLDSPAQISGFEVSKNPVSAPAPISVSLKNINSLLGSAYSSDQVIKTLGHVGIKLLEKQENEVLKFEVPAWRTDLKIKEDLIEEVGRLLGYDNLPLALPTHPFKTASVEPLLSLKSSLRHRLVSDLAANELLTYSFVSDALLEKVNLNPEDSYKLINSLSPELQRFRPALAPSLLEKAYENQKSGFKDFSLFEINQVSAKTLGLTAENVPEMKTELCFLTFGDFYKAKSALFALLKDALSALELAPLEKAPFLEPLHSAKLCLSGSDFGFLGEVKSSVLKRFKLEGPVSLFFFDLDVLLSFLRGTELEKSCVKLSRFPSVSRDLTVKTPASFAYETLFSSLNKTLKNANLLFEISPVSIFQKADNREEKHVSFHLSFASEEKTLSSTEISAIMKRITDDLEALGLKVI